MPEYSGLHNTAYFTPGHRRQPSERADAIRVYIPSQPQSNRHSAPIPNSQFNPRPPPRRLSDDTRDSTKSWSVIVRTPDGGMQSVITNQPPLVRSRAVRVSKRPTARRVTNGSNVVAMDAGPPPASLSIPRPLPRRPSKELAAPLLIPADPLRIQKRKLSISNIAGPSETSVLSESTNVFTNKVPSPLSAAPVVRTKRHRTISGSPTMEATVPLTPFVLFESSPRTRPKLPPIVTNLSTVKKPLPQPLGFLNSIPRRKNSIPPPDPLMSQFVNSYHTTHPQQSIPIRRIPPQPQPSVQWNPQKQEHASVVPPQSPRRSNPAPILEPTAPNRATEPPCSQPAALPSRQTGLLGSGLLSLSGFPNTQGAKLVLEPSTSSRATQAAPERKVTLPELNTGNSPFLLSFLDALRRRESSSRPSTPCHSSPIKFAKMSGRSRSNTNTSRRQPTRGLSTTISTYSESVWSQSSASTPDSSTLYHELDLQGKCGHNVVDWDVVNAVLGRARGESDSVSEGSSHQSAFTPITNGSDGVHPGWVSQRSLSEDGSEVRIKMVSTSVVPGELARKDTTFDLRRWTKKLDDLRIREREETERKIDAVKALLLKRGSSALKAF